MSQSHSERLNKLQFDHGKELETVKQNAKRDEATLRREIDELSKERNQIKVDSAKVTQELQKTKQEIIVLQSQVAQSRDRIKVLEADIKRVEQRENDVK